jgi:pilus assembly protein Flp/PilA
MSEAINYLRIQLAAAKARTERGASAVEYGLLVALIAIVIIVAVILLGKNLSSIFGETASSIKK